MSDDEDEVPDLISMLATAAATDRTGSTITWEDGQKQVPVTLITGYLGAGKSTLIHYVLNSFHGYRIAVVVNEYGDSAGIEKSIIHAPETGESVVSDWLELANGCICCSVKSDFVAGLEGLLRKGKNKFDYIIIETTGLANPGPIATALWTDSELESSVFLDSIVTVVDVKNIENQLRRGSSGLDSKANEAQQQLAYADLILLNKVDLIVDTTEELTKIRSLIKHINSAAEILETTKCTIDLERVLNRRAYIAKEMQIVDMSHDHTSDKSGNNCFYFGSTLGSRKVEDGKEFENWLGNVLWESKDAPWDIFRMKGCLRIHNNNKKHILQAVQDLYEISEATDWKRGEKKESKIILIGLNLEASQFESMLKECTIYEASAV